MPDRLIDALKEKSSGDGTVVKEGESTLSTSTRYTITYDGNPPARKGGRAVNARLGSVQVETQDGDDHRIRDQAASRVSALTHSRHLPSAFSAARRPAACGC